MITSHNFENNHCKPPRWIIGFYFTAFISTGLSFGSVYIFHLFYLIGILWVLTIISRGASPGTGLRIKKHNLFFLFMLATYALSITWSRHPDYTLLYFIYILIGISIITITEKYITDRRQYQIIFKIIFIAFIIELFISLLESLNIFRWPTSPYSEYSTYFGKQTIDWGEKPYLEELSSKIPTGFRGNPNQLALVMLTAFPFIIFFKSNIIRITLGLTTLFVIYSASSRGALLAIIFQILIASFLSKNIRIFIFIAISIFLVVIATTNQSFFSDESTLALFKEAYDAAVMYITFTANDEGSISHRLSLMHDAWTAFLSTYGFGLGGGGSFMIQTWIPGGVGSPASLHNFWMELLVDGGIFIFIGFFSIVISMAFRLIKYGRNHSDKFYRYHCTSLAIAVFGFIIGCVSASSVIYHLPMWIMIGMGFALQNIIKSEKTS